MRSDGDIFTCDSMDAYVGSKPLNFEFKIRNK